MTASYFAPVMNLYRDLVTNSGPDGTTLFSRIPEMVFYRIRMTALLQVHMMGFFMALAMFFGGPQAMLFFRIRGIDSRRTLVTHFHQPNLVAYNLRKYTLNTVVFTCSGRDIAAQFVRLFRGKGRRSSRSLLISLFSIDSSPMLRMAASNSVYSGSPVRSSRAS